MWTVRVDEPIQLALAVGRCHPRERNGGTATLVVSGIGQPQIPAVRPQILHVERIDGNVEPPRDGALPVENGEAVVGAAVTDRVGHPIDHRQPGQLFQTRIRRRAERFEPYRSGLSRSRSSSEHGRNEHCGYDESR